MDKTLDLRVRAIIGPEMAQLQRNLQQAGILGAQAGRNASEAGRNIEQGFQRGNRAAKDFNSTIQNTTKYLQLIKGVISAFLLYRGFSFLTMQAGQFTRALVDVQHQVGIIQTQLRDTGRDYRSDLTRNVMATAGRTGMSMESLARTEYEIVSANIAVADSYRILDLSAKAAVAGGLRDTELAFDAALSQVNAFDITFEKAFDLQFQTLKRGIFNYEQFTTAVGTLSEAFDSMGQSAEVANASAAAISQVFTGKQFERGATGLRNAVVRISEAPEDFEALGVAVADSNGEFRNFLAIAEDLNAVLGGMSSSQRAAVLKDLFPDERERRGINTFLGQLDKAEQFYVEQQFAAGSLNDAYETANDSLLTQARIFEQNLVPAMQPFVEAMSSLLGVFNAMDDMLPGFNKSLLTTATVAAIVGSGALLTGNRYPLSRAAFPVNAGPMMRGYAGLPGARLPTGIGIGAASLVPLASFTAAAGTPGGASRGDYFGSALGGAFAGGTVGGLPGAGIGALVGIAAAAFGSAFSEKAEPISKTFADRFSEALKDKSNTVADAFAKAIAGQVEIAPGLSLFQVLQGGGSYQFRQQMSGPLYNRRLSEGSRDEFMRAVQEGRASVTAEDIRMIQSGSVDPAELGFNKSEREALRRGESVTLREDLKGLGQIIKNSVEISLTSTDTRSKLAEGFTAFAEKASELSAFSGNENYRTALESLAADAFEQAFGPGSEVSQAASDFAVKMFEGGKGTDVFLDALQAAATGDFKRFLQLTGELDVGVEKLKMSFEALTSQVETLFTGDAELAASVFEKMGTEGEKVAEVFTRISQTMQAFQVLQSLNAMTATMTRSETGQEYSQRVLDWLGGGMKGPHPGGALQYISEEKNVLSMLGIDSTAAGQMLVDRLVADLGLVKGQFTTEQFVEALFQQDVAQVTEPLQLASNSLADSLFEAADQLRFGLLESTKFTADQLEMYGEEFKELNRLVRQRSILEELKGIAEFAGVGDKGIKGAMDILRAEMVNSGKALFNLLSDPASLAELIAKMEFGDVNVDNSNDYNFVFRVSGDTDLNTANAANFARQVIQFINEESRRSLS
jgi:Phage-related minor tail protein